MQGSVTVIVELMKFDKNGVISARNRITEATPLQLAAEGGHAQVVKVLVRAGASCSDENKVGIYRVQNANQILNIRSCGFDIVFIYMYFFFFHTWREQLDFLGRIYSRSLGSTKRPFVRVGSVAFVPIAEDIEQEAWNDSTSYGSVLRSNR